MVGFLNSHGTSTNIYGGFGGFEDPMSFSEDGRFDYLDPYEENHSGYDYDPVNDENSDYDLFEDGWYGYSDDTYEAEQVEIEAWVEKQYGDIIRLLERPRGSKVVKTLTADDGGVTAPGQSLGGARYSKRRSWDEVDEINQRRWSRRNRHGRGCQSEISWKRHAGGGRRGRETIRRLPAMLEQVDNYMEVTAE